jgi:ABC-type antimicrobial peptide transport system permease subunit
VGAAYPPGKYPVAFVRVVSEGYIRAMGIPLRAGRDLAATDRPETERVIVINETMARTLFGGGPALGGRIRACGERQVVGVVADVRHLALEQGAGMEMYIPMRQCGDVTSFDLVVRGAVPAAQLAAGVREALKPILPNLPGTEFRNLQGLVDRAVSPRRFVVLLIAGFAVFAVILASLGIYSVVSYSVNQRTQEIGIRMALGASAGSLQAAIVRQTLALAGIGMALGVAAAWAFSNALAGLLFGITARDPATFVGILVVLTALSAAASYAPARRASRMDPSLALRAN